jgi:hypothetical protein
MFTTEHSHLVGSIKSLMNTMGGSNIPFWRDYRSSTDRILANLQNTNPWNFASLRFITTNNTELILLVFGYNIATWPWEIPWISASTANTTIVAPAGLLDGLVTWAIVTFTCAIDKSLATRDTAIGPATPFAIFWTGNITTWFGFTGTTTDSAATAFNGAFGPVFADAAWNTSITDTIVTPTTRTVNIIWLATITIAKS